jgi:hypothetical protein
MDSCIPWIFSTNLYAIRPRSALQLLLTSIIGNPSLRSTVIGGVPGQLLLLSLILTKHYQLRGFRCSHLLTNQVDSLYNTP